MTVLLNISILSTVITERMKQMNAKSRYEPIIPGNSVSWLNLFQSGLFVKHMIIRVTQCHTWFFNGNVCKRCLSIIYSFKTDQVYHLSNVFRMHSSQAM